MYFWTFRTNHFVYFQISFLWKSLTKSKRRFAYVIFEILYFISLNKHSIVNCCFCSLNHAKILQMIKNLLKVTHIIWISSTTNSDEKSNGFYKKHFINMWQNALSGKSGPYISFIFIGNSELWMTPEPYRESKSDIFVSLMQIKVISRRIKLWRVSQSCHALSDIVCLLLILCVL